jgi:isopentenyldiphosphate isomerase
MKELLEIYDMEGEKVGETEKKEIHQQMRDEFLKKKKVSTRHKHVRLLLMTSNGRVILQRRSKWKADNPGIWDKTIGGHVSSGDSFDLTILKECAEELGIPATIVDNEDFEHSIAITNLNILAILTKLSYLDNYKSTRMMEDKTTWIEPNISQFYIGYYDGPIRFIDSESCGIQVFSKEELVEEIRDHPKEFSEDVKYIMEKFGKKIQPAPKKIEKVLND